MENIPQNHKSSKSWLILGAVCIVILFVAAFLMNKEILDVSYGAQTLISAIFGFGGTVFLLIGVIKFVVEKVRK